MTQSNSDIEYPKIFYYILELRNTYISDPYVFYCIKVKVSLTNSSTPVIDITYIGILFIIDAIDWTRNCQTVPIYFAEIDPLAPDAGFEPTTP